MHHASKRQCEDGFAHVKDPLVLVIVHRFDRPRPSLLECSSWTEYYLTRPTPPLLLGPRTAPPATYPEVPLLAEEKWGCGTDISLQDNYVQYIALTIHHPESVLASTFRPANGRSRHHCNHKGGGGGLTRAAKTAVLRNKFLSQSG